MVVAILLGGGWYVVSRNTLPQETLNNDETSEESMEQDIGHDIDFDLAGIVSSQIVGGWQSREDAKFIRSIRSDGVVEDLYEGEEPILGTWTVFTEENAPEGFAYPLEAQTVYLRIVDDSDATFDFKIVTLTPETLELVYLDRGGVLTFTRSVN